MVDVKKRTERMREELRKKFELHEAASRANQDKPQVPLSVKLRVALPLAALAIALYSWSYHYTRKRLRMQPDITQPTKILTDVREIFAPEEKTGGPGPAPLKYDFDDFNSELLVEDQNKRW